jgi:transposase
MPKTRLPYSPEFRRQMVELVRAGRDPAELAREFEPTAQSISHWVAQADRQEGRQEEKGNGLSAAEREELARLRRENKHAVFPSSFHCRSSRARCPPEQREIPRK